MDTVDKAGVDLECDERFAGMNVALRPVTRTSPWRIERLKASADLAVASAKIEEGLVFLPERAPWLPDLEAELFVFPGSRHDDQCDSISQALLDRNNSFMTWMTPEDWDRVLARSRIPGQWALRRMHGRAMGVVVL